MSSQSERLWRGQQRGGGRREVCDGQGSVSSQWVTLLGTKAASPGCQCHVPPLRLCLFVSGAALPQQLPGSLNAAKQTLRGTREKKAS